MLSTSRAELHYFTSPEDIPDDYAILSHVWDRKEQSFQDLQELQRRCNTLLGMIEKEAEAKQAEEVKIKGVKGKVRA